MLRCRSLSLAILASSFAASSFRRTFLIVSPQSPQTNQGIVNLIQGARENSRRGREFGKKKKSFDVFEVSEVEKKWLCPLAPFTFSLSLSLHRSSPRLQKKRRKKHKPERKNQPAMVLLPNVKWAQRKDKLFLTIDIQVRRSEKKCGDVKGGDDDERRMASLTME